MPVAELPDFEVLIADDDAGIRDLLTEWFANKGLTAASVVDGRAGISTLERSGGRYRLILADINMPGADGFAVLKAARDANESAYVVIMTGFASLDTAIHAVRTGAQDYLTKPFSLGQLEVILDRALTQFAHEQERHHLVASQSAGSLSTIEARLLSIERTLAHVHAHVVGR